MPLFIALLRGINVGKAKRIPMVDLRALLSGLGYTNATTLLNSGNAVFHAQESSPAQISSNIATEITNQLKMEVPVIVKSAKDLASIVAECPIAVETADHSRLLVAFAQEPQDLHSLAPIKVLVQAPEQFTMGTQAVYLLCPSGILQSKAGEALVGKAGKGVTTRNWATVLKLQALAKSLSIF